MRARAGTRPLRTGGQTAAAATPGGGGALPLVLPAEAGKVLTRGKLTPGPCLYLGT